jgi:hypothetical protein
MQDIFVFDRTGINLMAGHRPLPGDESLSVERIHRRHDSAPDAFDHVNGG